MSDPVIPERPKPQGGDYRPHYNKRDADAYIAHIEACLAKMRLQLKSLVASESQAVTDCGIAEAKVAEQAEEIRLGREKYSQYRSEMTRELAELTQQRDQFLGERRAATEDYTNAMALNRKQAATIERLTEAALTHPDFPTSCIHEEEPWYCDSCMLFYQEEMQHWHEKRDAALTKQP